MTMMVVGVDAPVVDVVLGMAVVVTRSAVLAGKILMKRLVFCSFSWSLFCNAVVICLDLHSAGVSVTTTSGMLRIK